MADDSLERAIAGALRAAIKAHGPITPEHIGSATKRIVGNLRNARLDGLASALGRRGGLARAKAPDFAEAQAAGGRAGRGVKKPRSEEAKRRMLARRLLRAADEHGEITAERMKALAPDRSELHGVTAELEAAAQLLGVGRELAALCSAGSGAGRENHRR
jgi:hypothetical protein